MLARAIDIAADKWWGKNAGGTSGVVNGLISVAPALANAVIGILSTDALRSEGTYSNSHGVAIERSAWSPDAHKVMSILGMDPPRQKRLRSHRNSRTPRLPTPGRLSVWRLRCAQPRPATFQPLDAEWTANPAPAPGTLSQGTNRATPVSVEGSSRAGSGI